MALADDGEPATCSCTTRCQAGAVNMNCEICASDMTACAGPEPEPEPEETPAAEETEPEPEEESGGMGGLLIILLIAALAGRAARSITSKFIKNKPRPKATPTWMITTTARTRNPPGRKIWTRTQRKKWTMSFLWMRSRRMRSYEIFHRQSSGAHDDADPPARSGGLTPPVRPKATLATAANATGRAASCPVTGA